jgi:threonine/homoserine/homoserine lactone efflux protein
MVISRLSHYHTALGILTLAGGLFLLYLAYENITYSTKNEISTVQIKTFSKGIIANFFSPHPYLFWILIGGPILLKAREINLIIPLLFVITFYIMLVGSKILIALLTNGLKNILQSKTFIYFIRSLGVVLIIFSVLLFIDAVNYIF